MLKNPDQSVTVIGGGSGVGIAALIDGEVEIAMASREMKDSEIQEAKQKGINLMKTVIATDGIAVVVNPQNPVTRLTFTQLQAIYDGNISNWKDVGGEDRPILVISRDSSSGTYEYFKEAVLKGREYRQDAIVQPATGAIVQEIAQNKGAMGYIGYAYIDDSVKALALDDGEGTFVTATEENVHSGKYPLARQLYYYSNGESGDLTKQFIDYVISAEGQAIVSDVGYFPVNSSTEQVLPPVNTPAEPPVDLPVNPPIETPVEIPTKYDNIIVKGSDTVLPLSQAEAEEFMLKNPSKSITVIGGGSGVGIAALIDSEVEVAMASRDMKDSEIEEAKQKGINPVKTVIAVDGIAVVVNPENPVTRLTFTKLQAIYDGNISNWKDVGGEERPITVIGRDSSSGTYEYFKEEVLKGREYRQDMLVQPATGAIVQEVAQNRGAIGYIGYAYLSNNVKALALNDGDGFVEATNEDILNGGYPLARQLYYYTDGQPTELTKDFINFIMTEEGKQIINAVGYIPTSGSTFSDSEAPELEHVTPAKGYTFEAGTTDVSVRFDYSDSQTGINTNASIFKFDGIDVTDSVNTTITNSYALYSVRSLSVGDHSASVYVVDNAGNEQTFSTHFTISAVKQSNEGDSSSSSSSSSRVSGSSGGGGGGAPTGDRYENVLLKEVQNIFVTKDKHVTYSFKKEGNKITSIQFLSLKNSGNIQTAIEVLKDKSSFAKSKAPGQIYQQMNIWVGKVGFVVPENVNDLRVDFKVEKKWLEENNIETDTVKLYRYADSSWNALPTTITGEDESCIYFESQTPGFSPFAIISETEAQEVTGAVMKSVNEEATTMVAVEDVYSADKSTVKNKLNVFPAILGGIIIVLIGAYIVYRKRR